MELVFFHALWSTLLLPPPLSSSNTTRPASHWSGRFFFTRLFAWLIGHQPTVLFSQNKPAISTFLSEQISVSHQPPAKRTGRPEKFNSFGSPSSHPNPIAAAIKSQTSISKMWTLGWDSVLSRIGSSELSVSCASFFPSGVLGVGTREWRCSLGAGKGTLERRHNREGGTRASVPGRTAEASLKPCSRYQELVIADFLNNVIASLANALSSDIWRMCF
jgi:hypothetical protein